MKNMKQAILLSAAMVFLLFRFRGEKQKAGKQVQRQIRDAGLHLQ